MVKYYAADFVLPITAPPIKNGVVAVNEEGIIIGLFDATNVPRDVEVDRLEGVLIPGFINGHCHLELSHLKGKIASGEGLVKFIEGVLDNRGTDAKAIQKAMEKADKEMFENGIQAVGDHVNSTASEKVKNDSQINYHTFVEIIGMDSSAETSMLKIDEARDIEFHFDQQHASITPHAPYSCSKAVFKAIKKSVSNTNILSIHSQESEEENRLFRYREGDFLDFYARRGIDVADFRAQARNSIQSYIPYLPTGNKLILVHNTFTSMKDVDFVNRMGREVVFCICPKANLFIEGTLPKLALLEQNQNIIIGTDSLASNDTLDVLAELKVLHRVYPDLDFLNTIKWATYNGAKALDFVDTLGSIEVGKKPGLVLLSNMRQFRLTDDVKAKRIV